MTTVDHVVSVIATRYDRALTKTMRQLTEASRDEPLDPFGLACVYNLSVSSAWWRDLERTLRAPDTEVHASIQAWIHTAGDVLHAVPPPYSTPEHPFRIPAGYLSDIVMRTLIADGTYVLEHTEPADPGLVGPLSFSSTAPSCSAADCCGSLLGHDTLCALARRDPCNDCQAGIAASCVLWCTMPSPMDTR
ncbi:hypothetical protein [Phytomonospora endophytica]|uniref:Uncharacterized protein n=1 Tax=Phytomonospora endophytica TaxID=714109 RepID=A0A841FVH1_9ACTN|nr:hypothetical protein [Phytomonospora endophytica]MBB6037728.1 hypothetical protein [Phytomonospora endophytica]GIG67744.1 hypothetical protein Pen01_40390 [Phytomonospora endophytica]